MLTSLFIGNGVVSRRVVKGKVELKYEGKILKMEKKVKCLGMIFDSIMVGSY